MTQAEEYAKKLNFIGKTKHGFELDNEFFEDSEFLMEDNDDIFGDVIQCPSRSDVARWEFNDGSAIIFCGKECGFGFSREELDSDQVKTLFAGTETSSLSAKFSYRETRPNG